jgi:3-oxoacyl-(acyl-carrier-protein) synthase
MISCRRVGPTLEDTWLTSLKPALGHSLGASAAVETAAAVLALAEGLVPATVGTSRIDPDLPSCPVAKGLREDPQAGGAPAGGELRGARCLPP